MGFQQVWDFETGLHFCEFLATPSHCWPKKNGDTQGVPNHLQIGAVDTVAGWNSNDFFAFLLARSEFFSLSVSVAFWMKVNAARLDMGKGGYHKSSI